MADLEGIVKAIQSLVAKAASHQVLAQHLDLLRAQVAHAQRLQADAQARAQQLEAQCLALQQSLQECQLQLQRFARDNPLGHRCDKCGAVDLHLIRQQPAQTGAEFGLRDGVYRCRVCQHSSVHAIPPPG